MKVTAISAQVHNPDRLSISIDGKYRFSLTLSQVVDEGLKIGLELSDSQLEHLEAESVYGKVYQRALEYSLIRPRSRREMADYLYKKTLSCPVKNPKTGEVKLKPGVASSVTDRVLEQLIERGYVDDYKFADFWVRQRFLKKGVSARRLRAELSAKGVDQAVIEQAIGESDRSDQSEIEKVIAKKRHRYADKTKFMQYLARQGFNYDDIKSALDGKN